MALRKLLVECLFLLLTALCLVAIFEVGGAVRSAAALLLVFVLPGRAFLAAWFPARLNDTPGNILLTLTLSIASAVIGGLVLNLFAEGLQTQSWALWLAVVTAINETVALLRTPRRVEIVSSRQAWTFHAGQVLTMLTALLIVVGALLVARNGAVNQPRPGFTQLWMIPGQTSASVQLGVQNEEGSAARYSLIVHQGSTPIQAYYDIQVNAADTWSAILLLPASVEATQDQEPIEADLYHSDQLGSVYRTVHLWLSETDSK